MHQSKLQGRCQEPGQIASPYRGSCDDIQPLKVFPAGDSQRTLPEMESPSLGFAVLLIAEESPGYIFLANRTG